MKYITGQSFLVPGDTIKLILSNEFRAHTCFNQLDIPVSDALGKEDFLAALDSLITGATTYTTG